MERIFISYKRENRDIVFSIKDYIERNVGEACWIDIDGIESDAYFANVIINAINKAEVFLFMYSASHAKIDDINEDWTVREIFFAQKKKKRIVFINIDGTPLTDWFELMFGSKQQIDATSDFHKEKLCKDLRRWLKNDNIVKTYGNAVSPSTMKANNELLKKSGALMATLCISQMINKLIPSIIEKKNNDSAYSKCRKLHEYEWHQIIRECNKQPTIFDYHKIIDAIDIEKLVIALTKHNVSVDFEKMIETCSTVGDLKTYLVNKK